MEDKMLNKASNIRNSSFVIRHSPALRFPDFEGEWVEKRLGEITSYVDYRGRAPIKVEQGIFLVTAKNIKKGYIDYEISKEYVDIDNYDHVMSKGMPELGDILFTTEAPLGNVCQVDNINIALAQRVIKLRGKKNLLNNYLLHYMLSPNYQKLINRMAFGTTVLGISGKALKQTAIFFPPLPEQTKIATFLSAVDKKIAVLEERVERLEVYKRGVMQAIFTGSLRFKDDGGKDFPDWSERTLGEIGTFTKGKGISKNNIDKNGKIECIRYGELYTDYNEVIHNVVSKTNLKENELVMSQVNDIIIPSSGETSIDIATASCVLKDNIALGGDLNIIRTKEDGVFLAYYLNNAKKLDIAKLSQGSSVIHLYAIHLKSLKINLPSLPEQKKIATYLSTLDKQIENAKTQAEQTRVWKQGLLQGLFV